MNRFYKKYRIVGNWLNIMLMLSVLIPLLALSFYNHPSPADDYCYIDTVFKFGWLEAMNYYYSGWTGRYFGIFLNHSNPLLFHWINGFKILPVILLVGLIYALYSLFRHLTPTLSRLAHLGFAGVVFFLYILKMGSISEAFYWMAAFVTYTIPNIFTLLWTVLALRWYRQDTQPARTIVGIVAGFLIFAVIGSSETNLLIMVLLIGGWWFYRLLFYRKVDGFMVAMLLVTAVSCYFYFSSPGNQARIGGNPLGGNVPFSIISSFKKLASLSFDWLFRTPLIFFSIAWLIVLSRLSAGARNYFSVPVWYTVLLFIGVLSAQLFPSYYGVGIEPTPRVINCVYFFFLIGWFYVTGVIFHYFKTANFPEIQFSVLRYGILIAILVTSVALAFFRSTNVRQLYSDLLNGTASAFDKEMFQRYAALKNAEEDVVYITPLKAKPLSIFYDDDVKTDKDHWWNKCMAGYFGKKAIYLKEVESE
ncbi:DUF6056 family protein [Dyadobacter sediminis]|uniref:Glycosyltransferase family 39 protein n=1 Tax=Dyadobacter sediminis TaxID=1493691 RepID=A0A5R9K9I2_9BACT|nr:DUF6056 family protein [Dyadobacter sediminis]TLU90698.1 hypothetical protein FEM55_19320 [Dyadobacter sediminis]GGC10058.1 hypothetical protein GCM10011325_41160 [Dyadobacter sediminis]